MGSTRVQTSSASGGAGFFPSTACLNGAKWGHVWTKLANYDDDFSFVNMSFLDFM